MPSLARDAPGRPVACRAPTRMLTPPPRSRARPPRSAASSIVAAAHDARVRSLGEDRASLLGVRPVQPDHDRHRGLDPIERAEHPLGHQVAAGDAAEDVDEHGPHRRIGQAPPRARSPSGRRSRRRRRRGSSRPSRPACATTSSVDITRPAPLPMMPTSPSSFTYCRPCVVRARLHRVDRERVLVGLDVRVPEQRVVVDRHLRVERDDAAVLEQDERVDLHERRVALLQQGVQAPEHVGRALARRRRGKRAGQLAHVERPQTEHRVDVDAPQRLGPRARELLDVHAALGGHHREVVTRRAVEQHRRVELLRDRQQLLDQHLGHLDGP